eukprot:Selendium_serpulae@DN4527_c0_g1_i1.p2
MSLSSRSLVRRTLPWVARRPSGPPPAPRAASSATAPRRTASMLQCDALLTDAQRELRDAVRKFAEAEVTPLAAQIDRDNSFPNELWPIMGKFGLLGPTASTAYGGLGLGFLEHVLIMEQLSRASGSVALSYGAHSNLCVNQISQWGTAAQKEAHLPRLIAGERVGALAMSEVGAGSDVVSLRTAAEPDGEDFVLNGTKLWITNGPTADVLVVYAKTKPTEGKRGITAFLVEKGMKGFSIGKKLDKLGMRGSETAELIFDDCRVPKANVLGAVDGGVNVLMSGLDCERLVLAAGPLGLLQASLDAVVPYVNERKQFDTLIADFELIQGKVADMYASALCQRALLYSAAAAYGAGGAGRADCAAAILTTAEAATRAALDAVQLLGGRVGCLSVR